MSGIPKKPVPPSCVDCGSSVCFPVTVEWIGVHPRQVWLCGSCEYLRAKPEAPRLKRAYVKQKNPQAESLLDAIRELDSPGGR